MTEPLAYRMRPRLLEEVIGQKELVGKGKIIWRMVQAKRLSSMILYGPPGTGKTSIASAIAGSTQYPLRKLNAATDTKKELQAVAAEAKFSGKIILLLDEIHRLDKTKQDFLLPQLESGQIILIGATTENPYLSINPAIRSRAQIFEVHPLTKEEMNEGLTIALTDKKRGLGNKEIILTKEARHHFISSSNGDLRSTLNALELAVESTPKNDAGEIVITLEVAEETLQKKAFTYDKDGDEHYDVLSAFQKSIRGSDPDAALHYLARLIVGGDLVSISRRLLVIAYEDIGLANPGACQRTVAAVEAANKLGFPEARIPLANAVIDLALSPKSNSAYLAIDAAIADVKKGRGQKIPLHLKDAHYQGAEKLGRGLTYQYPHDFDNYWVDQQYLPDTLKDQHYYQGKTSGKYEQALKNRYDQLESWKKKSR